MLPCRTLLLHEKPDLGLRTHFQAKLSTSCCSVSYLHIGHNAGNVRHLCPAACSWGPSPGVWCNWSRAAAAFGFLLLNNLFPSRCLLEERVLFSRYIDIKQLSSIRKDSFASNSTHCKIIGEFPNSSIRGKESIVVSHSLIVMNCRSLNRHALNSLSNNWMGSTYKNLSFCS